MSSKKVHAQLIFMNYPHTHSDHSYTLNIEPHKEDTSYSINVGTEVSWTLLCMHVRLQSQLYNYNDLQVVCSIGQADSEVQESPTFLSLSYMNDSHQV